MSQLAGLGDDLGNGGQRPELRWRWKEVRCLTHRRQTTDLMERIREKEELKIKLHIPHLYNKPGE